MNVLIYILFAVSGFAGLIYESIWSRYLKLFLGHAAYGQILTLIIYMGGLGLGAYLFGKWSKQLKRPLLAYAILELLIGLGGLIYHPLYHNSTHFFFEWVVHQTTLSPLLISLLKLLLVLLLTTPWAILLGGTFPCLTVALIRMNQDGGRLSLPWLYFTNSIGGALGILAGSYIFLVHYGTPGTLILVSCINILLAAIFGYLSSLLKERTTYRPHQPPAQSHSSDSEVWSPPIKHGLYLLLLTSSLTGFASFIYEVGWIRLLSLLLSSSTHSFDIMVSAFIFGLAWGGIFARFLLQKEQHIWLTLALIQIIMGVLAGSSLLGYEYLFSLVNQAGEVLTRTPSAFVVFSCFKYLVSLLLMFPASFCAGSTLPLITWLILKQTQGEEKWVGYVYAWNTLGAIIGSALGGLYFLPLLQLKGFILMGALVDVSLGALLLFYLPGRIRLKLGGMALALLLLIPTLLTPLNNFMLSSGIYLFRKKIEDKDINKLHNIQINHGKTATISILKNAGLISLATNGKIDASIYTGSYPPRYNSDDLTQAALALYPMQHINKPYHAAIIGMGSGMTAHYLLADPLLKGLELIEIEPKVYEMAKAFLPYNQRTYNSPKITMHFEDAKTFFYQSPQKYNLIISEPSNPWVSGVANLFTQEFYQNTKQFLTPDGLLVQWLQTYEFNETLMISILKALNQEFKHIAFYGVPGITNSQQTVTRAIDVIILASNQPLKFAHSQRLKEIDLQAELLRFTTSLDDFDSRHYLTSIEAFKPLMPSIPINSDYYPYVDNHAEVAMYTKTRIELLSAFHPEKLYLYPSLFDPEFYQHRQDTLQKNEFLIQNVLQTRAVLKQALETSPPTSISHDAFYKLLYKLYPILNWEQSQLVSLYNNYLDKASVTDSVQAPFQLMQLLKTGTEIEQRQAILNAKIPPEESNLMRIFVTHCLQKKWPQETHHLLSTSVHTNPQFSNAEQQYLWALYGYFFPQGKPLPSLTSR